MTENNQISQELKNEIQKNLENKKDDKVYEWEKLKNYLNSLKQKEAPSRIQELNNLITFIDKVNVVESIDKDDQKEIVNNLKTEISQIIWDQEWKTADPNSNNNESSLLKSDFMRKLLINLKMGYTENWFEIMDSTDTFWKIYKSTDYFKNFNEEFNLDFGKIKPFFETCIWAWIDIKKEEFWKWILDWETAKDREVEIDGKKIKLPGLKDINNYFNKQTWEFNNDFYEDLNKISELNPEIKPDKEDDNYEEYNQTAIDSNIEHSWEYQNPAPWARLTSPFWMRMHPIHHIRKMHKWIDLAASRWTSIKSVWNWVVEESRYGNWYGNMIVVNHWNWIKTLYAHLDQREAKVWDKVQAWQEIWKMGSTWDSTWPHLHFEFKKNWVQVNPKDYINI